MQIEWTEEEVSDAVNRTRGLPYSLAGVTVRAIMSRAVELWQARQADPDSKAALPKSTDRCFHVPLPGWRCTEAKGHSLAHKIVPYWPCSPTCTHDDAATPGHPERVRERSERFHAVASAMDDDTEKALMQVLQEVREAGAKAMRAACWTSVEPVLRANLGVGPGDPIYDETKAAIEGATP